MHPEFAHGFQRDLLGVFRHRTDAILHQSLMDRRGVLIPALRQERIEVKGTRLEPRQGAIGLLHLSHRVDTLELNVDLVVAVDLPGSDLGSTDPYGPFEHVIDQSQEVFGGVGDDVIHLSGRAAEHIERSLTEDHLLSNGVNTGLTLPCNVLGERHGLDLVTGFVSHTEEPVPDLW